MSDITCPNCHQIDAVQKITSIVGGETHRTTGYGTTSTSSSISGEQDIYAGQGWSKEKVGQSNISGSTYSSGSTTINATQQSALAKQLSPPAQPEPPSEPNFKSSFSATTGNGCLSIVGGIITFIFVNVVIGGSLSAWENNALLGLCFLFVLSPLAAGAAIGGIFSLLDKLAVEGKYPKDVREKMLSDHKLAVADYFENRLPRWQHAIQRWNSMFYCRRCDVVYVPGDSVKPVPPERVIDLCYHTT